VVFLLSGWLLELLSLGRGGGASEHSVSLNLGRGGAPGSYPRETDVSVVYRNRLHLISCKNEFVGERILQHLDRFRAVAAEFGRRE